MKKLFGIALVSLGIAGIVTVLVALTYVLLLLIFFCPIKTCWPQFIFFPGAGAIAIVLLAFMIRKGMQILKQQRRL